MNMSTTTGSEEFSVESSDSLASGTGLSSLSSDPDEDIDSDLEALYESFDFENEASHSYGDAESPLPQTPDKRFSGISETALYPGSHISVFQSQLLVFQYALRHGLTTKAFTELLQLLSVHLPQNAAIPKSVHSLKRFLLIRFLKRKLYSTTTVVVARGPYNRQQHLVPEMVVLVETRRCSLRFLWGHS